MDEMRQKVFQRICEEVESLHNLDLEEAKHLDNMAPTIASALDILKESYDFTEERWLDVLACMASVELAFFDSAARLMEESKLPTAEERFQEALLTTLACHMTTCYFIRDRLVDALHQS